MIRKHYRSVVSGTLILIGLYLTSLYNYLLFHSLAEAFGIVIAFGIFIVAWNIRRTLDNNFLLIVGIAYLFVAGLDLLHTLAYKGMGVFPGYETNLPTQLWIAARYLESLSLLIAPLLLGRRIRIGYVLIPCFLFFTLTLLSIFLWKVFPDCFIEGSGLTVFKKTSEYIICLMLAASAALLIGKRPGFHPQVLRFLIASIVITIASELSFTLYVHAYGLSNLIGHFFKIISFYLIYKALFETGLLRPYTLLFRNLKQSELALRESEEKYRNLVEGLQEGIWGLDKKGITTYVNPRMAQMLGYGEGEMIGLPLSVFMDPDEAELIQRNAKRREKGLEEHPDFALRCKDGTPLYALIETSPLTDDAGRYMGILAAVTDITERKKAGEELRWELNVNAALSRLYEPLMSPTSMMEGIAEIVLKEARTLTGSEYGYVASIDPVTGCMTAHTLSQMLADLCAVGKNKARIEFEQGKDGRYSALWGHSLNTGAPLIANSPGEHPASTGTPEGHIPIKRFLSVPVLLGKELVGQISLANKAVDYTERDLQVIQRLALFYALAIQRKRGEEALKAAHDGLEMRVKARIRDLAEANEELLKQIRERRRVEKALRESEKKYSTLVEESLTGVFIQQKERIVFANERFSRMHGYTREEIIGKASLDLVHPEDRPMVREYRNRRMRGQSAPSEYETRDLTKDGKVFWVIRRNRLITFQGQPAVLGNVADTTQRKHAEAALRTSERELRVLSSKLLSAEENERKRIAQELHDSIGQSLGAIKFSLENVLNQMSGEPLLPWKELLSDVIPLTQKAIEEVRRIVMDLRPSTLDDLGVLPTISWFCRQYQNIYSQIRVDQIVEVQEQDVPDSLKTVIYRIVQEALNNIAKHSKADQVRLFLRRSDANLELAIEDNGIGFDPVAAISVDNASRGFGLASMKERVGFSGGVFSVFSAKGEGARIVVAWPIGERAAKAADSILESGN